jgi:hypothetical protein
MTKQIEDVFWFAVKTAIATLIILVLLQVFPVTVHHNGKVDMVQRGSWDIEIGQSDQNYWWLRQYPD